MAIDRGGNPFVGEDPELLVEERIRVGACWRRSATCRQGACVGGRGVLLLKGVFSRTRRSRARLSLAITPSPKALGRRRSRSGFQGSRPRRPPPCCHVPVRDAEACECFQRGRNLRATSVNVRLETLLATGTPGGYPSPGVGMFQAMRVC